MYTPPQLSLVVRLSPAVRRQTPVPAWCLLAALCAAPAFAQGPKAPATPPPAPKPPVGAAVAGDEATTIDLHITKCAIREGETDLIPYAAKSPDDCIRINRATLKTRSAQFKKLRLKAGKYVFRVFNDDVAWEVDFALRGAHDQSLPHTGGGSMKAGAGLQYALVLTPGVYVYSSPKTPTLEYPILVEE